jgi:hypothetical protein
MPVSARNERRVMPQQRGDVAEGKSDWPGFMATTMPEGLPVEKEVPLGAPMKRRRQGRLRRSAKDGLTA